MAVPFIDIRSQRALIGIESTPGRFDIHRPLATMDVHSTPAKIDVKWELPELQVDSKRFWAALNGGRSLELIQRISSQIHDIVVGNIEHMVEKGNRMGDLRKPGNPIPDISYEDSQTAGTGIQYMGEASFKSIDMEFILHKPEVNVQLGKVDIRITPNKPDVQFTRGGVKIYMQQYPKVTITPPPVDIRV